MGKDLFRFAYDPVAALNNAERLMGMELKQNGKGLQGGYYLNGDKHAYRNDKLKVFISRGSVWVSEEGGRCISLPQWLIEFGGASDFKDAIRIIKGQPQEIEWHREIREKDQPKGLYVNPDVLMGAKAYDLQKCSLFRWMCRMFPEDKVRETWDKYNVTTDSHGNCVFWYTDQSGKVLFDKRILYREDGHRDKNFFPARQYRVRDGYTRHCYFGANTVPETGRIFVCESEKTALLVHLMYGKTCVATGGKGNLGDVDGRMMLLPDMDAREEWAEKGEVWPWWEKYGLPIEQIPNRADIGDLIVYKKTGKL